MNTLILIFLKTLNFFVSILGKKTGNMLGHIAKKLNPNILSFFKVKGVIIATTATNGKTMTNNVITKIFKDAGYSVISNVEGNNLTTGIISLLIKNSDIFGKVSCDYMCLEVDESYVPIVFKTLKLDTLVVGNFFRDQLDRNGEVEHLINKIEKFISTFDGNLVLNGDDPNVLRLLPFLNNKEKAYVIKADAYEFATTTQKDAGEGKYCPFCKTKLAYDFYQYSHIGNFKCPNCNFGDTTASTYITDIDLKNMQFKEDSNLFKMRFNNIYAVYNFALAIEVAKIYNIDTSSVIKAIESFELNNGRMEKLNVLDNQTVINLAKNPAGCNVSLRLLNENDSKKELLFVLNDKAPDGHDVSWIWDIDFEDIILSSNINRIILSGDRPYDIAIRIKSASYPIEKIEVYPKIEDAIRAFYTTKTDKYIITNYTSLQPTRKALFAFCKENK